MGTRRFRRRLGFVISGGLAGALLLFVGTAAADQIRQFDAAIFPFFPDQATGRICDEGAVQPLTLTYTNEEVSEHPTGSVAFTLPAPLVIDTVSAADAGGKAWTVTTNGGVITLVADSPADKIDPGESVSIRVDVSSVSTGSVTVGVMASQANDPGQGNQFTGNDLTVTVLDCTDVDVTECAGAGTTAVTRGPQSQSTATTDCLEGALVVGHVATGTTCSGEPLAVEVLVNPANADASTTVVTFVEKSLIGGNVNAVVVCKDGTPIAATVTSVPGGTIRVEVTFADGTDPIKGIG